jgi:tellurite resistance protein TerC
MSSNTPQSKEDSSLPSKTVVWMWRHARRVIIFIIGSTVLLIGVAMIVLPGPAFIVIPLGLTILATEFVWARRWLDYAKRQIKSLASQTGRNSRDQDGPSLGK